MNKIIRMKENTPFIKYDAIVLDETPTEYMYKIISVINPKDMFHIGNINHKEKYWYDVVEEITYATQMFLEES